MSKVLKRSEVEEKNRWRLEDIYKTDELWEKDFQKVKELSAKMMKYTGKIAESAETLYEVLELQNRLSQIFENVYVYAQMRSHEDSALSKYQAMSNRADSLAVEMSSQTAFVVPEIVGVEESVILNYIKEKKELDGYKRYLKEILRNKPYVLSAREEEIMAKAGELAQAPDNIFTMINDADMRFPMVKNEEGEEIELTKGRYSQLLVCKDRAVRKEAYETLYQTYAKQRNTFAATLNANVKANIFGAEVRGYGSAMEAALFSDNVSMDIYNKLIEAVHNRLDIMYRYIALRKKILGYEQLYMYDLHTPIVADAQVKIDFEEAKTLTIEGLKLLGETYIKDLEKAYESKWIDIYENEGKRSGAYSWGSYLTHPFVLLNHNDDLNSAFTLAHEMGHSMHTYYSNEKQAYMDAHYSIFVAEVASTLNESLMIRHMIEHAKDKNTKLYLINHYLEQFRTTVYRQVMFAEFEKIIHEKTEAGESLTAEALCEIYGELNKLYYGENVVTDEYIPLEWTRIPHFYNSFYVYKYATGFAAATALAQGIIKGEEGAVEKYLEFISSGGNDYPVEQLKKAGIDMSKPETVISALNVFEELLAQMEELLE